MMNCLCGNNNYLYILIILLALCCNGCLNDIIGKICECWYIIPIILLLLCCTKNTHKGMGGNFGCGCK